MDTWEGAAAIWAALDDLADKNPDYYKHFIETTLSQGPPSANPSTHKPQNSGRSKRDLQDSNILSSFSKLKLETEEKSPVAPISDTNKVNSKCEDPSRGRASKKNASLLDNDLGKSSIIASIIPKDKREIVDEVGNSGDSADNPPISLAGTPSSSCIKPCNSKSKPLIEEL